MVAIGRLLGGGMVAKRAAAREIKMNGHENTAGRTGTVFDGEEEWRRF